MKIGHEFDSKSKRDMAVKIYAAAIKKRLDEKAAKGYSGWDGKDPSDVELLRSLTTDAQTLWVTPLEATRNRRKLLVDIGARAMFLYYRLSNNERLGGG